MVVLIVGWGGTLALWRAMVLQEEQLIRAEFEVEAREWFHAIVESFELHLEAVHSLSDYHSAVPDLSREEFHSFAQPLLERHEPIQALEWIPIVALEDKAVHESEARKGGLEDYLIHEGSGGVHAPVPVRPEYFPVFFVEPLKGNERAIGFDLSSEAVRNAALQAARESGSMTLTGRVTLVQETEGLFGVLAFEPAYEDGEIVGFLLGVLRVGEIVENALRRTAPGRANLVMRDETASPQERVLYTRLAEESHGRAEVARAEALTGGSQHEFQIGGRTWSIQWEPTRASYQARKTWAPRTVLIGGMVVSILLAALVRSLAGQKAHVELSVKKRTAELRRSNEALQDEIVERKRVREKLRRMTSEVLLVEERERRKLASDLHDDLGQLMPLLKMRLQGLRETGASNFSEAIVELIGLVEQANDSVKSLTFQLTPPILQDFGLIPAIEWLVEDLQKRFQVEIHLEHNFRADEYDENFRVIVFRSTRELLLNAVRHAACEHIRVSLVREGQKLAVVVEDDGKGFDVGEEQAAGSTGFGLFSIRERLHHLGGSLTVESTPGRGARVKIELRPAIAPLRQDIDFAG